MDFHKISYKERNHIQIRVIMKCWNRLPEIVRPVNIDRQEQIKQTSLKNEKEPMTTSFVAAI